MAAKSFLIRNGRAVTDNVQYDILTAGKYFGGACRRWTPLPSHSGIYMRDFILFGGYRLLEE